MPLRFEADKLIKFRLTAGRRIAPARTFYTAMRHILVLCLLSTTPLFGQADSNRVKLCVQVGYRIHDDTQELGRLLGGRRILSSPTFGLMLVMPKIPLRLGWQTDFNILPEVPVQHPSNYATWSIAETWLEHQIQAYYDFKKLFVGVGGYWKRREGSLNHQGPGYFEWKHSGAQLSIGMPMNWMDIEFRTKIRIEPQFAALGTSQHSLLLLYNIDKKRKAKVRNDKLTVNGLVGARFFSTHNVELLVGEDLTPIGIAPLVGLEILHKKTGLSVNLERDWWLAANGGSFRRDVKGYINSAFIGLGYHRLLKNDRFLRLRLGGSFIIDYDIAADIGVNTPNKNKLGNYQVKGVGAMVSYEILPDTDIEMKHTFTILGDKLFSLTRFSVGLIYRYNPNK